MVRTLSKVLIGVGGLVLVIAVTLMISNIVEDRQAGQRAQELLDEILMFNWAEHDFEDTFEPNQAGDGFEQIYAWRDGRRAAASGSGNPVTGLSFDTIGILSLPTLGIILPVISEMTYANLDVSAARFSGVVTDRPESLVIGAHNFRHHFGALATMSPGDQVSFTTHAGVTINYQVTEVFNVHMSETQRVLAGDDWDITLFTCVLRDNSRRTIVRLQEI